MSKIASVVVDKTTYQFDKPFSYFIPPELENVVVSGIRVIVPFGNSNGNRQGFVLNVTDADSNEKLKSIIAVIDNQPLIPQEIIDMAIYMKDRLFCTYFDAISAVLPYGLNIKIVENYRIAGDFDLSALSDEEKSVYEYIRNRNEPVKKTDIIADLLLNNDKLIYSLLSKNAIVRVESVIRNVGDNSQKFIKIAESISKDDILILPRKQKEVASLLYDLKVASVKEIIYFTGASVSVINALVKREVAEIFTKETYRRPIEFDDVTSSSEIVLTAEQQTAFNGLRADLFSNAPKVSMLYGVTGSGKTNVFTKLVDEAFNNGKNVIIMVPEISLTPQMLDFFGKRYGNNIAVFHSAMSLGQRLDEWKRVKSGDAKIAIGTRSAIFAPFESVGLIVVDEEQEHTYKSEQTPRYNAKELAKFRVARSKGLLVLSSATPLVEDYAKAKAGKYGLYTIKSRYNNAKLPEVITVDMRKEIASGNTSDISGILLEELKTVLKNKKQAIILLNRRGYNTYIACPSCGYVATCERCSISLTYHSANKRLMCHHCGHSEPVAHKCPSCGFENLKFMGSGTQKVEEELKFAFPDAGILRLDADTAYSGNTFKEQLRKFADGDYDILLGTQMVAKGLDFENVVLVGVIGADSSAYSEDFKSFERTFSLLTQVVGRAGRGINSGKAIIQTVSPDSNVLTLAKSQDYDAFFDTEISMRKLMIYPPYCDLAYIIVKSENRELCEKIISQIYSNLEESIKNEFSDIKIVALRPTPAAIPKINNIYRYRMILKFRNSKRFREMLRTAITVKQSGKFTVTVDINPETVI